MRSLRLVPLLLVLAATAPAGADHAAPCVGDPASVLSVPVGNFGTGRYVLPSAEPTTLVAFAHGYGHTSASWVEHMKRTAAAGAIAFAMDYRGTETVDGHVRGWRVFEGAEDTVGFATHMLTQCPQLDEVIIYGVSMGGNTSGLAVAMQATRPDGVTPLFDYWVAGEPAANVLETYAEATAVGPANAFAVRAREDIETAFGGTPADALPVYLDRTVVLRVPDIAASGLKGVAIVHAFDDGLVPYNQGLELATLLRAAGVPTDMYHAVRRETDGTPQGSDNTTITENATRPVLAGAGLPYTEPLAGHGTESSDTHIVIQTGLDLVLWLMQGHALPANHDFLVDGEEGVIQVS